jgi:spectinomycin phosphotransferase
MRTEPDLDRRILLDFLRDRYLMDIERLEFVPYGVDSWSYVAVRRDGGRAFLKLVRPAVVEGAARRGAELPLMAALADLGRVPVARPLADRTGELTSALDGFEINVLEHLEGPTLEDEAIWPDALYGRVAETVGAIHASTGAVRPLIPDRERYELPFAAPLARVIATLEARVHHPGGNPALAQLRDLVVPRAAAVRAGIDRLDELRDLARIRSTEEVLCHTDIWGSNLLLSDDGALYVLDWNGASLGPPERDLFMFASASFFPADRLGWFLDRYEATFRPRGLDAEMFGFYLFRRSLEDLAGFVSGLAEGNNEAMDPSAALGIVASTLAELTELEDRIGDVRRVLTQRA